MNQAANESDQNPAPPQERATDMQESLAFEGAPPDMVGAYEQGTGTAAAPPEAGFDTEARPEGPQPVAAPPQASSLALPGTLATLVLAVVLGAVFLMVWSKEIRAWSRGEVRAQGEPMPADRDDESRRAGTEATEPVPPEQTRHEAYKS